MTDSFGESLTFIRLCYFVEYSFFTGKLVYDSIDRTTGGKIFIAESKKGVDSYKKFLDGGMVLGLFSRDIYNIKINKAEYKDFVSTYAKTEFETVLRRLNKKKEDSFAFKK